MRALVMEQPGEPAHVEDLLLDEPGPGEVRVRISASGVCHSDLHLRDAEWDRPGPIVLGHEGSGIVEAVGTGVTSPRPGQQVVLSWYAPCLRCGHCQAGRQWVCSNNRATEHQQPDGTTRLHRPSGQDVLACQAVGTMAERAVVTAEAAIPIPLAVAPEVAALIGCCVATGVGGVLKTADVPAGATVAVFGLGGVGLAAVMGAVIAGAARIVAVDRVPAKLARAVDLGATHTVLATEPDATVRGVQDASGGGGPDFSFEAVGLPATIAQSIAVLPRGGTAVLLGLTPMGALASFDAFSLVDGSRRIMGSNYGFAVAATDFPRYAELHLAGRLPIERLIDARIGLDDVEDAFARMRLGEGVRRVITF